MIANKMHRQTCNVILLDSANPEFNLNMEILASLPLQSHGVILKDLARDLGIPLRRVQSAISELKQVYRITTRNLAHGRVAWIDGTSWISAHTQASAYLSRMERNIPCTPSSPSQEKTTSSISLASI